MKNCLSFLYEEASVTISSFMAYPSYLVEQFITSQYLSTYEYVIAKRTDGGIDGTVLSPEMFVYRFTHRRSINKLITSV